MPYPLAACRGIGWRSSTEATVLLLDETGLGSAAAAYSVRKLRAAYAGDCCRIRRSSDSKEMDFAFDNGWLTASSVGNDGSDPSTDGQTLATFCSGTDGFVTTWYNQSGSAAGNAVQTVAAFQPQIVSAGALVTQSGKVAMLADATTALQASNVGLTAQTIMMVWRGTTAGMMVEQGAGSGANDTYMYGTTAASISVARGGVRSSKDLSANWANSADLMLVESYHNGTHASIAMFLDNAAQSLSTYSTQNGDVGTASCVATLNIFARNNGASLQSQGYCSELILWTSDLNVAGTRSTAAANINAAFALY